VHIHVRLKESVKRVRGSTAVQLVLSACFLLPLVAGIYLSTGTNRRSAHATEVSRDLASMYAQGVDFSQPANRNIARQLLNGSDGKALLILTRIRGVGPADCGSTPVAQCSNNGYAVITQRIVIGDPSLRPSSLGDPLSIDQTTGNVLGWTTDASARVTDSSVTLKPGESALAVEAFIGGPDEQSGVYSRTLL
jgi:hypothetical protein